MAADYSNLTVGDLSIALNFDFSGLANVDWNEVRQYLIDYGAYTPEVETVISLFSSGDYFLLFKGLDEIRLLVNTYPSSTLLSDIYGDFGGGPSEDLIDYPDQIEPSYDSFSDRFSSPLYDLNDDGSWDIPGLSGISGLDDFNAGSTANALFDQIADAGIDVVLDQARDILERLSLPTEFVDTVNRVREVHDIVTNFHSNLFDLLEDGLSGRVDGAEYESRLDTITGNFQESAREFVSDELGVNNQSFFESIFGVLHLQEVNSFQVNYWKMGAEIIGGAKRDSILTNSLDDVVAPGLGQDIIFLQGGSDRVILTADGSFDQVNGGDGLDFAIYDRGRNSFAVSLLNDRVLISDGSGGVDDLTNVERLQFIEGTLALDTSGTAGQTYRLYQAAFARTPDNAGLKHNIGLVDGGLSLAQMSSAFLASAEFQQRYGSNVSDTAYINALYRNVLGRDADPAGQEGWQARLNDGSWTRTTLLIGFSESPENIKNVAPAINDGIWLV